MNLFLLLVAVLIIGGILKGILGWYVNDDFYKDPWELPENDSGKRRKSPNHFSDSDD